MIEEDQNDQASVKEDCIKVPKNSRTNEKIEDIDGLSRSFSPQKRNSENFADDELDSSKMQAEKEKEVASAIAKKKSRSPALDLSRENHRNQEHEEGNKGGSESESSSDTSSSSDDETGAALLKKKSKEKGLSGADNTKGSSPLLQINNPKKSERGKKTMTYSTRLDSIPMTKICFRLIISRKLCAQNLEGGRDRHKFPVGSAGA